jgi:hypothetical protein
VIGPIPLVDGAELLGETLPDVHPAARSRPTAMAATPDIARRMRATTPPGAIDS